MKYRTYRRTNSNRERIMGALKKMLYSILIAFFVLTVWIIEEVLRKRIEHGSELAFSTSDTLIFLSNSSRYDFIVAISIGIIFVIIGYGFVKRCISKLSIICILICIITGSSGLYIMRYSYINVTYDELYIGGAISGEKIYKFEDISNIQSYFTKKTSKNSSSYKFNYSVIMKDGETIELTKDIDGKEVFKLDKVHRLLVDKYKINYYTTGKNDSYYKNFLKENIYDKESKEAIKDIFEDKLKVH